MTGDTLTIDVRMTEQTDDEDGGQVQRGTLKARVADQEGSPLPDTTITVSETNGAYEEEKSARRAGIATTFSNIPIADLTVRFERTGYEPLTVPVKESDFGGADITRGY
jgi:protocatechuate 3,4-dioxygenase beta subunit